MGVSASFGEGLVPKPNASYVTKPTSCPQTKVITDEPSHTVDNENITIYIVFVVANTCESVSYIYVYI